MAELLTATCEAAQLRMPWPLPAVRIQLAGAIEITEQMQIPNTLKGTRL
jgi:hypothetical protein